MTDTTKATKPIKTTKPADDKYTSAALDAIQEQMRIDNFAPMVLNAVESDVKLRNGIKALVAEAIREKPEVKKKISEVVDQNQVNKIYKILKTAGIVLITAIITALGTWLVAKTIGS